MENTIELCKALNRVKLRKPLIHQITNYVTVNDCANVTLAIGASPIMADAIEESGDIASIAAAVVLNIGTLNPRTVESMLAAGSRAHEKKIPVILDPVGAGASPLRSEATLQILGKVKPVIVRGNLSEIAFIAGEASAAKGVDVSEADRLKDAVSIAKTAAQKYKCTVAVTGAVDIITDGTHVVSLSNGHPMMAAVTGTGCMSTALIGAFAGAVNDSETWVLPAAAALAVMGIAGDHAFKIAGHLGTGSFKTALIDAISQVNDKMLSSEVKIDVSNEL